MSDAPVAVPASVQTVAVPATPAKPMTAIGRIEAEVADWMKQHTQAVANVHAIEGAIQGGQRLLAVLKDEEAKAIAEAKKVGTEIKKEAEKLEAVAIADAAPIEKALKDATGETVKVLGVVEQELKKI